RVLDRLGMALANARDAEGGAPLLAVERQLDRRDGRLADVGADRGEDLEDRAALGPALDGDERLALLGGGPLVDDQPAGAVPFVDRAGEVKGPREPHAVEAGAAVVALADLEGDQGLAVAVGRQGAELAGAAPGAVAVPDLVADHAPVG